METATGTESRVCDDIAHRQALGIAKYGKAVADNPLKLREWLQHAYEEALDNAVYLKRAIEEMDGGSHVEVVSSAVELMAEIINHEVNPEDECEKWLRAYAPHKLHRDTECEHGVPYEVYCPRCLECGL